MCVGKIIAKADIKLHILSLQFCSNYSANAYGKMYFFAWQALDKNDM